MCAVYGVEAECDFEGDLRTLRWYDVKRCSLLSVPTQVDCDKGCLGLIKLARVRPGQGDSGSDGRASPRIA
jgi:hypothetical protein